MKSFSIITFFLLLSSVFAEESLRQLGMGKGTKAPGKGKR
eukprot:CAMPEP_0172439318 /NCGR_PEP_ID=MMETSP1065-20121228/350_1 /TAXON_ID=265537 /ORGANISM="Amphiprora paludosa, Strain CCMP125" /LENGTH=39 /DNA_ID= /DNA_START= /DNA_END= /DNA_ORIENTATION=